MLSDFIFSEKKMKLLINKIFLNKNLLYIYFKFSDIKYSKKTKKKIKTK